MPNSNPYRASTPSSLREKFDALRIDLADLALALEGRRQIEAADVALSLHALIGEIRDELAPPEERTLTSDAVVER